MNTRRIVADLHTHTLFTPHAYSTLAENVRGAQESGLVAMAVTDHTMATPDSGHYWHFENLPILPDRLDGVRLLTGMEANVVSLQGELDVKAELCAPLDVVIASMHGGIMPDGSVEELTAAWSAVARHEQVDIIGHCGARHFAFDYETVIPLFGHYGKVVEINENTFRVRRHSLENCRTIAKLCARHGVRVAVNSDAHFYTQVGQAPLALQFLEELEFPQELVINGSVENLRRYLAEKEIVL